VEMIMLYDYSYEDDRPLQDTECAEYFDEEIKEFYQEIGDIRYEMEGEKIIEWEFTEEGRWIET
jgi:hypothetical protein